MTLGLELFVWDPEFHVLLDEDLLFDSTFVACVLVMHCLWDGLDSPAFHIIVQQSII